MNQPMHGPQPGNAGELPGGDRIDVVGDLHGFSAPLRSLLAALGYARGGRGWSHPEARRLVFVGDYVDRGADPVGTVALVRELCDDGAAFALLGNHDANAIQFSLRAGDGGALDPLAAHDAASRVIQRRGSPQAGWLRPHDAPPTQPGRIPKNIDQHEATIARTTGKEYAAIIEWAARLPAWLELPGFRAVHAAWITPAMQALDAWARDAGVPSLGIRAVGIDDAIRQQRARASDGASRYGDAHWRDLLDLRGLHAERSPPGENPAVALERVIKGVEARLPGGVSYRDSSGHRRDAVRVRWFEPGAGRTFAAHALMRQGIRAGIARDTGGAVLGPELAGLVPMTAGEAYPAHERPVFFGHYGLQRADAFASWPANVACVDMTVFDERQGELAAYRWEGERALRADRLVVAGTHP